MLVEYRVGMVRSKGVVARAALRCIHTFTFIISANDQNGRGQEQIYRGLKLPSH